MKGEFLISYLGINDKESESPSKVSSFISHTKQNILQMSELYKYSQLMLSTTSLVKRVHMYAHIFDSLQKVMIHISSIYPSPQRWSNIRWRFSSEDCMIIWFHFSLMVATFFNGKVWFIQSLTCSKSLFSSFLCRIWATT